jgi:Ca2+-binding RTX toxin-like protein
MKTLLLSLLAAAAVSVGAAGSTASTFPTCLGEPATKIGTPGDDTITATDDDDVIVGLGGNDTIVGGGGFDLICGGDGNDSILQTSGGFFGAAFISGDAGDDTIQAGRDAIVAADYEESPAGVNVDLAAGKSTGDGSDTLVNVDFVYGSAFDDVISGSNTENILAGFGGNDTISGLGGADLIGGETGDDIVDGGAGRDEIFFGDSPKAVHVRLARGTATGDGSDHFKSIENVTGSKHADLIVGGSGPNVIYGGPGNDYLLGFGGGDRLYGNGGKDRADGGPGRDLCVAEKTIHCHP